MKVKNAVTITVVNGVTNKSTTAGTTSCNFFSILDMNHTEIITGIT